MNKKYKLNKKDFVKVDGVKLYRIVALQSFGNVEKGETGGYIQSESNLSDDGNAWVYDNDWLS